MCHLATHHRQTMLSYFYCIKARLAQAVLTNSCVNRVESHLRRPANSKNSGLAIARSSSITNTCPSDFIASITFIIGKKGFLLLGSYEVYEPLK